jgi:hypothetical protein
LFSPGTPVSSINKTDCHDITEILFFTMTIISQIYVKIGILLAHVVVVVIGTYINITGEVVEDICLQYDLLSSDDRIRQVQTYKEWFESLYL